MESKYFYIKSNLNDLVLDVKGEKTSEGAKVITWTQKAPGLDLNQLFYIDHVFNTIRSKISDLCLTIDEGMFGGNSLELRAYTEKLAEKQRFEINGNRIQTMKDSNRVLDIAKSNMEPGAKVCVFDFNGGQNQLWTIVHADPRWMIIKSKMHGKVLDIYQGIDSPGAEVVMWTLGDAGPGSNQLWYEDRNGLFRSKLNNFVFDTSDGQLRVNPENGHRNQQWMRDGQKIVNKVNPDRCLDIKGEKKNDKARVIEYDYHEKDNQHWEFVEIPPH